MGERAMIRTWALRAALLAIVASIPLRIANEAAAGQSDLLKRTQSVLEHAGYQVKTVEIGTGDGRTAYLMARSAACARAVQVSVQTIAANIDQGTPAGGGPAPLFAFGEWSGSDVSRVRLVLEVMRLRLRYAISFGRAPWASPALLRIDDPSMCMVIATPDLARIWRNDGA